jgi:hypothetical protein
VTIGCQAVDEQEVRAMSLPGFSAQASLRAAVRPYRGRAVFASSATSQAQTIVPSHPACNIWRETQSADLQAAAGATSLEQIQFYLAEYQYAALMEDGCEAYHAIPGIGKREKRRPVRGGGSGVNR